jgi:hypothetical protein
MTMRRWKLLGLLALTTLGMLGAPVKQAAADHWLEVRFDCKVTLKKAIGYPTIGPNKNMLIPATINCGKNKSPWPPTHLDLGYCSASIIPDPTGNKSTPKMLKVDKETKALAKLPNNNPSNCDINAPKTITVGPGITGGGPWCGSSSGGGTIVLTVNKTKVYNIDFTYTSAAGELAVQGTITKKGSGQSDDGLAFPVTAVPDRIKGDTCTGPPWADEFNVTGGFKAYLEGPKP